METKIGYILTGGNLFYIDSAKVKIKTWDNGNLIVPATHHDLTEFLNFLNDEKITYNLSDYYSNPYVGVRIIKKSDLKKIVSSLLPERPVSPFIDVTVW